MFINQNQREEFELARSCLEREQRLPVRHHHKKNDVTTSGFTRKEALELLTTFYRDCGHKRTTMNSLNVTERHTLSFVE